MSLQNVQSTSKVTMLQIRVKEIRPGVSQEWEKARSLSLGLLMADTMQLREGRKGGYII